MWGTLAERGQRLEPRPLAITKDETKEPHTNDKLQNSKRSFRCELGGYIIYTQKNYEGMAKILMYATFLSTQRHAHIATTVHPPFHFFQTYISYATMRLRSCVINNIWCLWFEKRVWNWLWLFWCWNQALTDGRIRSRNMNLDRICENDLVFDNVWYDRGGGGIPIAEIECGIFWNDLKKSRTGL